MSAVASKMHAFTPDVTPTCFGLFYPRKKLLDNGVPLEGTPIVHAGR